jgi:hypothetical protein
VLFYMLRKNQRIVKERGRERTGENEKIKKKNLMVNG